MRKPAELASALFLASLIVSVAACAGSGPEVAQGIDVGKQALDFKLESLDGDQVSLNALKGSVLLINFWATWCAPCRSEIPDFEAAYQAHKDEGFVVLGVNIEESSEAIEPFVAALGVTFPVLLDEDGQMMNKYRGRGLPMSLIVDREGVIRVRHVGLLSASQLDEYLAQVLR